MTLLPSGLQFNLLVPMRTSLVDFLNRSFLGRLTHITKPIMIERCTYKSRKRHEPEVIIGVVEGFRYVVSRSSEKLKRFAITVPISLKVVVPSGGVTCDC